MDVKVRPVSKACVEVSSTVCGPWLDIRGGGGGDARIHREDLAGQVGFHTVTPSGGEWGVE